ncbi:MAG: MFS transporter [Rugosibacter sp.]|nr:MFS transporter [Rugosibacter sp.]
MNQSRCLSAWYFWYFAFVGVFQPYFSLYLQSLAMSAGRIAVLMSLGQMIRLVAPMFWGWLADHTGQRVKIVVMSLGAALVSFSAIFLTRDFLGLLLSLTILHFFWSASLPLVEALTLAHLTDHPERYGRIRLWGSVGFIFAVLGMGWLLDIVPITLLLWVSWALLLGTVFSALLLKEAVSGAIHTASSLRMVLSQPKVVFLLVAGLFMIAAHGALYVFYSIHLVAHGYGKTMVGLLWTLGVVAEIIVFLLMPRIAQGISLRHLLLLCFALAVLRFMLIGWQVDSLIWLLFAQCLHGATFGVHHVATMAALNRWFSSGQQARAQAIYGSVAYGVGGLTGGLLAGALWESAGSAITFGVSALLALIGFYLVWYGVPASSDKPVVR